MSKFKVGDKVKIISLEATEDYNGLATKMKSAGDTFIISCVGVNYRDGSMCVNDENHFSYTVHDLVLVEESKPELQVNYILLPDSITLSFNAQLISITKNDHRYASILEAIRNDNLELIPDLIDVAKSFSNIDGVELVDGRIHLNGKAIPDVLNDRVLAFKEQDLPFEPLIKFADKLLTNPSFNSRKMLYKFLEKNGHPITKDGNFIAYKGVNKDFTDCHTGKFDNSVGNVVEMDRNEVDDNPDNTCSSGLHVAAFKYADGFGSTLIEVEIDPKDVVAVPNDYDGEKMRVCKYKVVNVCKSKLEDVELYDNDAFGYDEDDDFYDDGWGL